MKEEWLLSGAVVPVDVETTAALVAKIKRLIDVVGGLILNQGPDYERGFVDGMQKQMQSSVDKAVNAMTQPVQEPVAWMNPSWIDPDTRGWQSDSFESTSIEGWIPIYNTPPQRQWVGLTDEEVENLCLSLGAEPIEVRFIEAKLKEKNT